ncbi:MULTISPECIES: hypothetical protein [unclassified Paenibacillus]|uniref:hypothetical protein n=1 Tax=unclassified Paenibacillus TaxID=185978 RepID=UPI00083927C4|nr:MULTISPECIES: hypothetical protein [unclassified Paenibacillus]NWL89150.1 hypothetical protein [Paenibacillus sp. 79R4]
MKSRLSHIRDAGQSLTYSQDYKRESQSPEDSNQYIHNQERLLLWDRLVLRSGTIRQPWHEKLCELRRSRD